MRSVVEWCAMLFLCDIVHCHFASGCSIKCVIKESLVLDTQDVKIERGI